MKKRMKVSLMLFPLKRKINQWKPPNLKAMRWKKGALFKTKLFKIHWVILRALWKGNAKKPSNWITRNQRAKCFLSTLMKEAEKNWKAETQIFYANFMLINRGKQKRAWDKRHQFVKSVLGFVFGEDADVPKQKVSIAFPFKIILRGKIRTIFEKSHKKFFLKQAITRCWLKCLMILIENLALTNKASYEIV